MGGLSDPRIAPYFQSIEVTLQEGQRVEVNLKALDWMEKVARYLKWGFVLTIDYGYLSKELHAPHRKRERSSVTTGIRLQKIPMSDWENRISPLMSTSPA